MELEITKPAVSRALFALEEKGFVHREKDENDRRASKVHLTEKARASGQEIQDLYSKIFSLAAKGLSEDEIHHFIHVFKKVSKNLDAIKGDT